MRKALLTIMGVFASCFAMSGGAMAAFTHSVVEETFTSPNCTGANNFTDIAVHEASSSVYVVCFKGFTGSLSGYHIEKFDFDGGPVDFAGSGSHIEGNRLLENPGRADGRIGLRISVDNSGTANDGIIYTVLGTNGSHVEKFLPSGEWAGRINQPYGNFSLISDEIHDVDVGSDGSVYVSANIPANRISRYDTLGQEKERLYQTATQYGYGSDVNRVAVDSTGAVWINVIGSGPYGAGLYKYEADQFKTNLNTDLETLPPVLEPLLAYPSPYFSNPLLNSPYGSFPAPLFSTDPETNDLYVAAGGEVRVYSPGTADTPSYERMPRFGGPATVVEVMADHRVWTINGQQATRYGTGAILPDVDTHAPDVDNVGHTEATLTGEVKLAGGAPVTTCVLQTGTTTGYTGPEFPCIPAAFGADNAVSATATGLTTGDEYHYRFRVTTPNGSNVGVDRLVVPAFVLKVKTHAASDVTSESATFNGSLDPDGMTTSFRFQYGLDTGYGQETSVQNAGAGFGETAVSSPVENLPAGRTWHYRLVASNANGTTHGPDRVFRTASPPEITGVRATEVTATSAVLNARIDPVGYATKYRFEYGTTPEYGQSIPIEDVEIGTEQVDVSQTLEGLSPGVTHHFRVVANNQWGESSSANTTFDFSPPSCPNNHVRQQTRSSYLPDCRAYELVSPEQPGSVIFWPSDEAWMVASSFIDRTGIWLLNTGRAISPPRFAYYGAYGSVDGTDAPNYFLDLYVATRTTNGWNTTLPVISGSEAQETLNRQCAEDFSVCIDHKGYLEPYHAPPYMFDISGSPMGRLPTNVDEIAGADTFSDRHNGEERISGEGGHYVFFSRNVVFAPEGVSGGMGSAYDNDIAEKTVTVVSRLPDGSHIPQDGPSTRPISFPGLSPDGSHILLQAPASAANGGGARLYMRVNQAITYDVSRGMGVQLVGATRDASKVLFIASQQLTPGDSDASDDLYMWTEQDDSVVRVTQSNDDDCSASWTSACSVEMLETDRGHPDVRPSIPDGRPSIPGIDDKIADTSGDVYFLSPESLDPTRPGIRNQQNLYVVHGDEVQLVTTLDAGTRINRINISPDGSHAAFLTASRLTAYDNNNYRQMYTYDAERRLIRCASCNPNGLPPGSDVFASMGGPFMSDDGRAFFATRDSLVSRDANGQIMDVYEYVDGKPQLISSGLGARDYTGGSEVIDVVSVPVSTGLESVSADGTDVFFSTYETLVPQDQNGEFVKFYTARTNGGFATKPQLAPCAAADECHGPDSSPPAPPRISTATNLGTGGNLKTVRQRKRAAKKKRTAKRRRAARKRRAARRKSAQRRAIAKRRIQQRRGR